jgi:GTP-binding protein
MAQTKFVLGKALQKGLQPIVVMNKVDRDNVTEAGSSRYRPHAFEPSRVDLSDVL